MTRMRETGAVEIEASEDAESEWVKEIAEVAETTLLTKVDSWYMNTNLPGKPRVFTAYFSGMHTYAEVCADVAKSGYKGFELRSHEAVEAV